MATSLELGIKQRKTCNKPFLPTILMFQGS